MALSLRSKCNPVKVYSCPTITKNLLPFLVLLLLLVVLLGSNTPRNSLTNEGTIQLKTVHSSRGSGCSEPNSTKNGDVLGLFSSSSSSDRGRKRDANEPLPPLDTLLMRSAENQQVVADIQFLLDFAILGFPKCGTSTLHQWLQEQRQYPGQVVVPPEATTQQGKPPPQPPSLVRMPPHEPYWFLSQDPAKMVKYLYRLAQEEQKERRANKLAPTERFYIGYKNPGDIARPYARDFLAAFFPETPIIITVRHPVHWIVSLYNYYRIEKGRGEENITAQTMLQETEGYESTDIFVSARRGAFHAVLASLGKTSLHDDSELVLLQPWLTNMNKNSNPLPKDGDKDDTIISSIRRHRFPNPIFFLESNQLADPNATRTAILAHDVETFIGLPNGSLPLPIPRVRPHASWVTMSQEEQDALKIDVCQPQWEPVVQELMQIGRNASRWLVEFFLASPDVTVSSPDYVRALLQQWNINPCDGKG